MPTAKSPPSNRRQPRAAVRVKARITVLGAKGSSLEATLSTADLSVGGIFLESTFFLKGTPRVDVELTLPDERQIRARGKILRMEETVRSGFAVKFTDYV